MDGATALQPGLGPGGITICVYCSNVMQYADDLTVTKLPRELVEEVYTDPQVRQIRLAIFNQIETEALK